MAKTDQHSMALTAVRNMIANAHGATHISMPLADAKEFLERLDELETQLKALRKAVAEDDRVQAIALCGIGLD